MQSKNTRLGAGRKIRIHTNQLLEVLEPRQLLSTWYVSPAGNDAAGGSLTAPWKTVQHALDAAASGDVINLRAGSYQGGLRFRKPNLTLRSYSTEKVFIVAPITNSAITSAVAFSPEASGAKLINLDISGGYYYALKTDGTWDTGASTEYAASRILITNCRIHDSGRDVVKLTPRSDYIRIEKSEIYNSGRRDPSNAEGIDGVNVDNFVLRDSYVHDTTTNGVYLKGGSINTLIERNRIANTAHSGILLGQSTDDWFFEPANTAFYESINGVVRNNVIWNTQGAGMGAWAAKNAQFYNNTLVNVAQSMMGGFLITSEPHAGRDIASTGVTLVNNIVSVSSGRPVVNIRANGLTGAFTTSNNRYYRSAGAAQFADDRTGFWGTLAQWKTRFTDAGSSEGDPRVNPTANYHLFSDSPLINKGKTLNFADDWDRNSRPLNLAWDIGADEFGGTILTPTTTTTTPAPAPDPTPILTASWQNSAFASQSGDFILEFDATPTQAGSDVAIGLSKGPADAHTDLAAIVRFNSANTIDARNGAAYAAQTTLSYAANATYHIKLVVRAAQHTYDVYVTPQGGSQLALARNYAFRSEQIAVASLDNRAKYNEAGDAILSNVALTVPSSATPTPTPTPVPTSTTNLAQGKTVTTSSVESTSTPGASAVDGDRYTRWASAASDLQWLTIDLGARQTIGRVNLNWEYASAKAFQIQVSDDNANWTTLYSTTTSTGGVQDLAGLSGAGRYVRINMTQRNTTFGYSLWEVGVFSA